MLMRSMMRYVLIDPLGLQFMGLSQRRMRLPFKKKKKPGGNRD
jgi:hypothetical protein